jgi:hypothetical protein
METTTAAPAIAPAAKPAFPDALRIPAKMKTGKRMPDRVDSIATRAEKLLGLDRSKGQLAGIRIMGANQEILFITPPRDHPSQPYPCLNFDSGHDRAGQCRYRWEMQSDGIEFGYLVEGADDDA